MKHESLSPPPASPGPDPSQAHGPRWTPRKMTEFLRALAASHSVTEAAKAVGMSRQSAYRLRSRLKGMAFDAAWDEAFHHSYCNLAHAALERALNGIEVPHYYKGELIGTSRRYDERLTVGLLRLLNSGGVVIVGGEGEAHGRRLERLLVTIEAQGEAARDQPGPMRPLADPLNLSPMSEAEIMAEFGRFRGKPRG
jgi:hypothetical protein